MRRDKRNKRRLAGILTAVLCIAALSGGCAPTEQTVVQRGPDFSPTENVALDFVQLHNDTLDCFGGVEENPYVYIMDLNITGDNDEKSIVIDAVCMDDTTEEEADQFAAAVIRHVNDSAVTQSTEYTISSQQDFGNRQVFPDLYHKARKHPGGSGHLSVEPAACGRRGDPAGSGHRDL